MRVEEGECFNDIRNRTLPFINNLIEKHSIESNILLLGHGGTFRCIFPLVLLNIDFTYSFENSLKNTDYVSAKLVNGFFKCIKWGEKVFEE